MKELTIEQKAKAYDEALKRAKEINNERRAQPFDVMTKVFHELKEESEDELKWLTEFIKEEAYYLSMDIRDDEDRIKLKKLQKSLAWLEKQDKETSWKPSKEEMDVLYGLAYITNQYDERKEEVITRLYQDLKREFFNGSSYENMFPTNTSIEDDVRRRSTIQVLEYARSLDTYNQFGKADIDKNIAWLEKQKEPELSKDLSDYIAELSKQFPEVSFAKLSRIAIRVKNWLEKQDKQPRYSIGDVLCDKSCTTLNKDTQTNFEIVDIRDGMYICDNGSFPISQQDEYELVAKKIEQNPVDKSEPKFKVGDWIIHQGTENIYQVVACIDNQYQLRYGDNYTVQKYSDVDKNARLWDITKDAKDGDVLAVNGKPFICYHTDEYKGNYCCIDDKGCFRTNIRFSFEGNCILPATKEQRDLLFAKMKEAGYEWNAEKKELKKIEQKSTDRREPKFKVGDWVTNGIETVQITGYDIDYGYQVDYKDKLQHRDTDIIEKEYHLWTIQDVKPDDVLVVNWDNGYKLDNEKKELKKIEDEPENYKQQVIPEMTDLVKDYITQTPAEWSEEDDSMICELIHYLNYRNEQGDFHADLIRDWVVSLKDRTQSVKMKEMSEYEKGRADAIAEMKKGWSEEDEKERKRVIGLLEGWMSTFEETCYAEDCKCGIDWLKSLKQRKLIGG